jgi:hypothetical protein
VRTFEGEMYEGNAIPPRFCTSNSKIRVKPHYFKTGGIESFLPKIRRNCVPLFLV